MRLWMLLIIFFQAVCSPAHYLRPLLQCLLLKAIPIGFALHVGTVDLKISIARLSPQTQSQLFHCSPYVPV